MTLESELKHVGERLKSVDETLHGLFELLQRMAYPPHMVEPPQGFDPELYGATQWRAPIQQLTPRVADPRYIWDGTYISGQWKRRHGFGMQDDLPTGGGGNPGPHKTDQQLDPWARRSPPAVDV